MAFRPLSARMLGCGAALFALTALPGTALADPPAAFEKTVEDLRQAIGVPGMSIVIVEDGKITFSKGFGVRKQGEADRVTADTIFPNGSTGKAFTSVALALLVDQGKIKWDDPVIDHIPGFQMYDPYVTREITVRDLLVHRSGLGLGAGDLLFVPSTNLTRKEAVKRLRHIKPATSFRSGYAYDNILYMVAGQLIEEVTGQTWEAFVAEHVLKKAGMKNSTSDDDVRFTIADRAHPHARISGPLHGMGPQSMLNELEGLGRTAAPAGGLAVSANDLGRWLQIQLAQGKLPEGGTLFSEKQAAEMWKPVVLLPTGRSDPSMQAAQPNFSTYALGWNVKDYKGAKVVSHGGAVFGFQANVVMIPEKNVGFAILINSEDGESIQGLSHLLMDHYLQAPTQDWISTWRNFKAKRQQAALKAVSAESAKPARSKPSLPVASYAGTYKDAWYGPIDITEEKGKLRINFKQSPRMTGTLEHWQFDSFRTVWDEKSFEPAFVTFGLTPEGKIDRITMKAASPIADFSWDYHDLLFTPVENKK